MRLILVRHGETIENVKEILAGHSHGSLTKKGVKQAIDASNFLKDENINFAIISDLDRTVKTTNIILRHHENTVIRKSRDLRDRDDGIFTLKQRKDYLEERKKSNVKMSKFKPTGGESFDDVHIRVIHLFKRIKRDFQGKTLLIVSHTAVIAAILMHLDKVSFDGETYIEYRPENCAISIINFKSEHKFDYEIKNSIECLK